MDAIRAWLQDRKNLPIVAAGTGIIVIVVALVFLKTTGTIGSRSNIPAGTDLVYPEPGTPIPGAPGMPGAEGMPAPLGAPVPPGPGVAAPGAPAGAPEAAPSQQVATAELAKLAPMLPYRKDPFVPLSGVPKKEDVIMALLPRLSRPRIAPAPVMEGPEVALASEVLPPQPVRRLAGVLYNGRVSAILETNGETDIVRPGTELTRGNSRVRVESIQQDCIILKTLDTATPMTIKVNLAASVTGGAPGAEGVQPGYVSPGRPAIYPGRPTYSGEAGMPAPAM